MDKPNPSGTQIFGFVDKVGLFALFTGTERAAMSASFPAVGSPSPIRSLPSSSAYKGCQCSIYCCRQKTVGRAAAGGC